MADALITIAVPSLNQGRFLDKALASIFDQDIPVEVFVMDGGSSDETMDIIRKWEPRLAGWRSHPDGGQAAAINEGITRGTASYVCWLNSDDFFYPGGLNSLYRHLFNKQHMSFVYGKCWTVSEKEGKLSPYLTMPFLPWLFANFCFIAQPATLIRREAWEQAGGLDENMHMAFDYDLWWRLFHTHGAPGFCRAFVAATRMHSETKTANQVELHYRESIEVVARNRGKVPLKWKAALPFMKMIRRINK